MTETEPWSYHPDGSPVHSLADIIRKRAAATPAAEALAEAGRLTSFEDLDRRSSQVAGALQAGGVRPYGAAKALAIFTAVNNRLSAREILGIPADAEPTVLIVDPLAAPLVAGVEGQAFDGRVLMTDGSYLTWRDAAPAEDPAA